MLGWRYWALGQEAAQVAREIEAAQREEARLQEILKQVQEFENRRKMLEARVALIDELRKGQSAPVHMVDQISKALPDMTWLTSMQQNGYTLTIQGRCLTLTSLSDFIGNLEASRYFIRPVEIIETTTDTLGQGPRVDPVHHPRHLPDGGRRIGGAAAAGREGRARRQAWLISVSPSCRGTRRSACSS